MDVLEDFSLWSNESWSVNGTIVHFSYMKQFIVPTMVLYGIFSVVGSVANAVVIITVIVNRSLHTLTNVFIAQLSLGDLIILIFCMPFTITSNYFFKFWPFGKFMCYFVAFSGCAGATITVCMLTVMCYERYAHLINPLQTMATWNRRKVVLISIFVYGITIVRAALPPLLSVNYDLIYNMKTGEENYQCYSVSGTQFIFWYNLVGGIVFYFIMVIFISLLYSKICSHLNSSVSKEMMQNNPDVALQRKRVVRMLVIMATSFIFCWLLINSVHLFYLFPSRLAFGRKNWYVVYLFMARMLEYGNCVVNPVLYSFLSISFQKAFVQTWGVICPCLRKYSKLDKGSRSGNSSSNSITTSSIGTRATSATTLDA